MKNKSFEQWVEKYLNNTLSEEEAVQLLQTIQEDPEKLETLSRQVQADRLLSVKLSDPAASQITEKVLNRINSKQESKIIRPPFWRNTRAISRIAASLFILMSLTLVIKYGVKEDRPQSLGRDKDSKGEVTFSSSSVERPQMKLEKPQPIAEDKETTTFGDAPAAVDYFMQSARVEKPKMRRRIVVPSAAPPVKKLQEADGIYGYALEISTESYAEVEANGWKEAAGEPLSTFSIDVDTASYANIRRFLTQGQQQPKDAVRVEEMINYFHYNYPEPTGEAPFSSSMALHTCPWNRSHHLLRVGLQGKTFGDEEQKPSNLVFLLDVSGSMNNPDKLPLLKDSFKKMLNELGANDRVAIVAYAGATGLVLPSTPASEKETIMKAMDRLQAGGSTAGGAGIELAYRVAADHFIKDGINRVILATDGDFNVGISSLDDLQKMIEAKRKTGVFLSVLGFGQRNIKDDTMELLANKGNGNYYYIDSSREADKVLVRQLRSTLVTIAKDVKVQVEFNPALIRSYRLIGYENRALANQDFADDTKDAGEIGAGHQVTALYELIPVGAPAAKDGVDLKYAKPAESAPQDAKEFLTLKLRYKEPEGSTSKLLTFPLGREALNRGEQDIDFRWAASVAAFGEKLRQSGQINEWSMADIIETASGAVGPDPYGYRKECINLMKKAAGSESTPDHDYPQWQHRN